MLEVAVYIEKRNWQFGQLKFKIAKINNIFAARFYIMTILKFVVDKQFLAIGNKQIVQNLCNGDKQKIFHKVRNF